MQKIFSLFFFQNVLTLLIINSLKAQTIDTTRIIIENGWIEKMDSKVTLELSLNNNLEMFKVKTLTNKMLFYPNSKSNINFSFNYRFVSFSLGIAPRFVPGNNDEKLKGKTNSYFIGTDLIFKHWFFNLNYSRIMGFYLFNTKDFIPWKDGDSYLQFPDLLYKSIGLSAGYKLNSKYSLRSVISQTERQLKSVGSLYPSIRLIYYVTDDRSGSLDKQKANNIEFSFIAGYNYNLVIYDYYITIGSSSGVGYLKTNLMTQMNDIRIESVQDNYTFEWKVTFGAGHNGRKFYSGIYASMFEVLYKQENTTIKNTEINLSYHIFFGIRLNAPNFLKRETMKLEHLIKQIGSNKKGGEG